MLHRSAWILAMSTALLLGISTTGCARQNDQAGDSTVKAKSQVYENDGLLGISSVNPNSPLNPTYHHYADDVRMMKETIRTLEGVTDSTIVLSGPRAYITLKLADSTDIEQAMHIRGQAQDQLSRAMPRYDVRVSVKKNPVNYPGHY